MFRVQDFFGHILGDVPSASLQALLVRAAASLERGRGADAAQLLAPALRSSALTREDELSVRSMLAEAALLQDDLDQAATALGRPPDTFRDTVSAAPAVDAVAAARPPRLGARRSVARHRACTAAR